MSRITPFRLRLFSLSADSMVHDEIRELGPEEFEAMTREARVLSEDGRGIKVLETGGGDIIKLFRLRSRISSASLFPYSKRFIRNASALKRRGVRTVDVIGHYKDIRSGINAVVYRKVSGKALRGLLESGELPSAAAEETIGNFAVFLARLHLKGVLFRSIHFGNVMVLLDGSFALVDIADINYRYFGALTPRQRIRNFIHMSRYEQDRRALKNFGIDRFVKIYMDASEMHAGEKQHFSKLFDSKMRKTYVDPLERI